MPRMDTEFDEIKRLWNAYRALRFPPEMRETEINGEHLVLLDEAMAGCIWTFVGSDDAARLDWHQREILADCAAALANALPQVPPQHRTYFDNLHELAQRVLRVAK